MKRILLLFTFLFILNATAFSQNQPYIPMAIDSAYWLVENVYTPVNAPPIPEYSYALYGTNGDTVVNNLTYKKAFNYYIDTSGHLQGELIALLRDDTTTRKVYMINLIDPNNSAFYYGCAFDCPANSEFVLYDFALNTTADTLYNCSSSFGFAVAQDTSYQLMYGKTRKVILTSASNTTDFEWYEGIGGQTSPFSRFANGYLGGLPNYSLYDYCVGNLKDCGLWSFYSSTNNLPENLDLNIFPNPAKDILNVKLETFQDVEIRVYNALGQLLNTQELLQTNTAISLADYSNGMYYLQFVKDFQILKTEKFLIVK